MADRRLQIFHAVARQLSFTRAAEGLFMTQPAVTFQIRQLEEQLNTRLFDRANGRIRLTPAGTLAFEYAERILGLSSELESRLREMGGDVSGPLLVGASMTIAEFLLPRVLGEFKTRHPGVTPHLFVANSEAVQNRIVERGLDVGFIEGDSHLPSLATAVCCQDELQVVCTPSHPLARERCVAPAALVDHAYVSRESGSGTREVIDHYMENAGLGPNALRLAAEAGSPEALKGLVTAGVGFSIMSRAVAAGEARLGELVRIPLAPRLIRQLSVVYPKERFHSRLVGGFVEFARERLAAMQDADAAIGSA